MSRGREAANWETFLWALYQLGGSTQFVDVEQIALKCFEMAPARFAWRTRLDLPNYKICMKALQEADARRPQMMLKTGDSFGRQLTAEGQRWIEANAKRLSGLLETGVCVPESKRRPTSRMLAEIEGSDSFVHWTQTGTVPQEKWRIADVLRCSPDSNPVTWKDRLESARAVAYAADKDNILRFLDAIAAQRPDWFGG